MIIDVCPCQGVQLPVSSFFDSWLLKFASIDHRQEKLEMNGGGGGWEGEGVLPTS